LSVAFIYGSACLKPWLHERFFACGGDAIFLKLSRRQCAAKIALSSHPRTGDMTAEKIAEKNREKFNDLNFCDKITDFVKICRQV